MTAAHPWIELLKTHAALFFGHAPFGVYVVIARGAVTGHLQPHVLVWLRLFGGLVAMAMFHWFRYRRNIVRTFLELTQPCRKDFLIMGAALSVTPLFFVFGLRWASAVAAAAMDASSPAIAVTLALLLRTEPLRPAGAVAVALSLLGNSFVLEMWPVQARLDATDAGAAFGIGPEHHTHHGPMSPNDMDKIAAEATPVPTSFGGEKQTIVAKHAALLFGAFLCFVSSTISVGITMMQKRVLKLVAPLTFMPLILIPAFCFSSMIAMHDLGAFGALLHLEGTMSWAAVGYAVFFQGWCPGFLTCIAIKRSSPVMCAMYTAVVPGISALLGHVYLGETVMITQLFGILMVVASVAVASLRFDHGHFEPALPDPTEREDEQKQFV